MECTKLEFPEIIFGDANGRNGQMPQSGIEVWTLYGWVRLSPITDKGVVSADCQISIHDAAKVDVCAAILEIDAERLRLLAWMIGRTNVTGERYGKPLNGRFIVRNVGRKRSELEETESGEVFSVANDTIFEI